MAKRSEEIQDFLKDIDTHWEESKQGYGNNQNLEAYNKKLFINFHEELLKINLIIEEKGIEYLVNSWRYKA